MAATRSTSKDAPVVNFDVDVENELIAEKAKPPFVVKIRDREIEMTDAGDLDWQVLIEMDHPADFIDECVKPEDKRWFLDQHLSGKVLNRLMDEYQRYYDIKKTGSRSR